MIYQKQRDMNTFESFLETTEINGKTINVYGIWDSEADFEAGKDPDYFDVYESDGMESIHLNEGDPWYEKPTVEDCAQLLDEYYED